MSFDVEKKVALVTGANRGIGKAIVVSLIEHGAAKVYAAVRSPASAQPLIEQFGESIAVVPLDLTQPDTIKQAAAECGDVELVVSNAGILKVASALDQHATEVLGEEIEVNVYGLIRMAQAFSPVLAANGGGAFVQLNSVASLVSFPDFATYCASKAAAYSITQALRVSLAAQKTTVLSVHPGPIATDMAQQAGLDDDAEPASQVAEAILAALASGQFHVYTDTLSRQTGAAYESFAKQVIEAND